LSRPPSPPSAARFPFCSCHTCHTHVLRLRLRL
jgi:hypothetical protein